MSRDNDVFQVLVTKGNQALLPAGQKIETLADGQIGIFDAKDNLSVDGTGTPPREFYIAVGVHEGGALKTINQSAGELIQRAHVNAYTYRPHTAGRPMIVKVSDYKADCDTDYAIKVEFRNQKIYRTQGFIQYSHVFNAKTSCCEGCEDCPSGDANEITQLMVKKINADDKGLLKAEAIARTAITAATHGTSADYAVGAVVSEADVAALITFNTAQTDDALKVYTDIQLTSQPLNIERFLGINLKYYNPRETVILVSLVEGFRCNGTVTTTQEVAFEEGNGYDIQHREYKALGYRSDANNYLFSDVTMMAKDSIVYYADANQKYDRVALEYQHEAQGGWLDYKNELATEIAIPEADTVTRQAFLTAIDLILANRGFEPLADDAATASTDPTVVEKVEDKTADKDGFS